MNKCAMIGRNSPPLATDSYLLLVNDANVEAFRARYPGVRVGGLYDGSLSNRGERLALIDRNGETVLSVDYDDGGSWPSEADGEWSEESCPRQGE